MRTKISGARCLTASDARKSKAAPEMFRVLEHIERHAMDSLTTGEQKMVSDALAKARGQ